MYFSHVISGDSLSTYFYALTKRKALSSETYYSLMLEPSICFNFLNKNEYVDGWAVNIKIEIYISKKFDLLLSVAKAYIIFLKSRFT